MPSFHLIKFTTLCSEKDVFRQISSLPNVFVFDVREEWRIYTWPDVNVPITAALFDDVRLEKRNATHSSEMPFCSGYIGKLLRIEFLHTPDGLPCKLESGMGLAVGFAPERLVIGT